MKVYEIVKATNGVLCSGSLEAEIVGVTQDSRNASDGYLYVPIIGENHDGHDFIDSAFSNGAVATFTSHTIEYADKIVIQVQDTLKALQQLAHYIRTTHDMKVVGVTGSVGKTSTRDMIYSVVSQKYKTLKTLGNYNNEIGLPLTILRYQDEDVLILEMGMNHLQEISLLSKIANPDIAVITNVGTAHIGELGSRENILKAKLEIVDGMKDGILIVNDDNDMLHQTSLADVSILRVGTNSGDIMAKDIVLSDDTSDFKVLVDGKEVMVHVPVPGEHFVINALLAIAVGKQLDIPLELCIKGIHDFELTKNRMDTLILKNDIKVIDGTYNASEDSMKSSIDVLSNHQGRKICVLADMLEMGEFAQELHLSVGNYVGSKDIDILVCVGQDAKYIQQGAKDAGMQNALWFASNQEVIEYLDDNLENGDIILCKGSNGMKVKEVVESLKEKLS
ncbi:MAG: UDP-N-acetylmuramoyl-tripeptide--D-alanyl-D-alanine ligase [Coprobacillaceae bacterium]